MTKTPRKDSSLSTSEILLSLLIAVNAVLIYFTWAFSLPGNLPTSLQPIASSVPVDPKTTSVVNSLHPANCSLPDVSNHKNKLKYTTDDLVCGVITTQKYHETRAKAVKETWGRRCGVTLFFSAFPDAYLPTVVLPGKCFVYLKILHFIAGSEEGTIINEKVFGMFKYVWEHHSDKKWFIKVISFHVSYSFSQL